MVTIKLKPNVGEVSARQAGLLLIVYSQNMHVGQTDRLSDHY